MKNNILNPYVKGLADGAKKRLHIDANLMQTPSVEPDLGMFLESLTYSLKPEKILEIGCGIGVSTRYMLAGSPDSFITAVDYNKGRIDYALESVNNSNVEFVLSDGISYLKNNKKSYDLIFIDSVKKQYPITFYYAYKRLKKGGTIIIDDVFIYGEIFCEDAEISPKYINAVKALRDFIGNIKQSYRHSILPVGGGVLLVHK